MDIKDLSMLNRNFEKTGELPEETWHAWLWGTDPEEPCSPEVMLNRNQLLGILVCRYKHRNRDNEDNMGDCDRMALMEKPPSRMTFRELKDTIANLQFEWPPFVARLKENRKARGNLIAVVNLIEACAARFGALCDGAFNEDVLDDLADVRKAEHFSNLLVLTPGALRRCVGTLLILFRHVHLLANCEQVPKGAGKDIKLNPHHYEASMTDFYTWYMHFQLPVGAKLCYKHDFPGMYNHVSQPVYFHNPLFTRCMRRPLDDPDPPAIHTLPSLCQIYPEVPVKFEEECIDVTKDNGWYWLIVSGRVYLVAPGPRVFYADDARDLMGAYVE